MYGLTKPADSGTYDNRNEGEPAKAVTGLFLGTVLNLAWWISTTIIPRRATDRSCKRSGHSRSSPSSLSGSSQLGRYASRQTGVGSVGP